jgi:hypothetical protein
MPRCKLISQEDIFMILYSNRRELKESNTRRANDQAL